MAFGAEVFHSAAEQAPLHTGLDHQRQIAHREHLDLGDGRPDVTVAAVFLLEPVLGGTGRGHDLQLLADLGPRDDGVGGVVRTEDLVGQFGADAVLDVLPAAVEGVLQMLRGGGHNRTLTRLLVR